jgi:hypothetical protein
MRGGVSVILFFFFRTKRKRKGQFYVRQVFGGGDFKFARAQHARIARFRELPDFRAFFYVVGIEKLFSV